MAKKNEEPNPYLEWLKQMPKAYQEVFLKNAFESYMSTWGFHEKAEEIMARRICKILEAYFATDEFQAKLKERAEQILSESTQGETIIGQIIKYLKD